MSDDAADYFEELSRRAERDELTDRELDFLKSARRRLRDVLDPKGLALAQRIIRRLWLWEELDEPYDFADQPGFPNIPKVYAEVRRLESGGYLTIQDIPSRENFEAHSVLPGAVVTVEGARLAGLWPQDSALAEQLVAAIDVLSESRDLSEEDKGRLGQLRKTVTEVGTDVVSKVLGELAAKMVGL